MAIVVTPGHNCKAEIRRDIKPNEQLAGAVVRCSCGTRWKWPSDPISAAVLGWTQVKDEPLKDVPDML